MLSIKDFDLSNAASTGGVTGSKRVVHKEEQHFYQLKSSIHNAPTLRKIKAGSTDRENFGEVIAACIGLAFLGDNKVPNVQLVYDKANKKVLIASKYLESQEIPPQTLNEYLGKYSNLPADKKHIKIVPKYTPAEGGYINITDEFIQPLLPGLAQAIAVSVLTGDHDVNPGNMLVLHEGNPPQPTIARIDFGHAFNDLLNAPVFFGGKLKDKEHPSLDFFNRESVAGFPAEAPSKLWRDYPGLIPSEVLAKAMCALAEDGEKKLRTGIDLAKSEFTEIIEEQRLNRDVVGFKHTLKSLNAIYENITGKKLSTPRSFEDNEKTQQFLDDFFDAIEANCSLSLKDMARTGLIMQLQMDIDSLIEFEILNSNKPRDAIQAELDSRMNIIRETYRSIDPHNIGIEWVKNDPKTLPFKGNLDAFITHRKPILGELISRMQESHESYATRIKKQIFSDAREGSEKKAILDLAIQESIDHIENGDLAMAKTTIRIAKQTLAEEFGERNFLGIRSTAVTILEGLEADIQKAQNNIKEKEEEDREGAHM
ncbi:Uncharacterised protein (plasmid) [Legionella adelaidensis]|uniref:LepB N-terminal domain-containing protein n=1 Tax=Legionella adelaidensis TaxID=45056 RepID=A0A0W0R1Z0_9GAMM|nr:hypothetical protein [Legionella adelaidensis]KTC64985.1 hypothetical protein Lade_1665 [Legionella adelaidensis]VEH85335.1 Uncharacterised protein [Legionella adelaidensis]